MPTTRSNDINDPYVDEETALLASTKSRPIATPLEWSQILIILLLLLCEPLTSHSIFPYINELIGGLDIITGGDERKVGYYAGLIESLFFVTQAMTVLQWSRVSDHVGRKPVLLIGLTGLALSITFFGLSRTFWALIASRCLSGVLNGNIGVMKSVLGELTDSTNRAHIFSLTVVVWAGGSTLGPLIGGSLANPHDRFPKVFSGAFWKDFPYFLPAAAVAAFVTLSTIIVLLFFKETVKTTKSLTSLIRHGEENTSCPHDGETLSQSPQPSQEGPVPMRDLFIYRVLITIANYLALGFLDMSIMSLQPLFFAMPIEIGGLGLSPPTIGYTLGAFGAASGLFQITLLGTCIKHFGLKHVFYAGIFAFIPMFCLFPVMSISAQEWGMTPFVWVILAAQLALRVIMCSTYACINIYITSSAPNKRSLGSTNGLAQATVSMARAVGPAMSTSLFSLSVQHNILGGYGVYAFFCLLSILALFLAARLPQEEWKSEEE